MKRKRETNNKSRKRLKVQDCFELKEKEIQTLNE